MADQGISEQKLTENRAFMDKYSRQIGAYGIEAMSKLVNMKVLICGMKGVGIETAKNLILAGPGQVTVWDNCSVEIADLGSNFFLTESCIGRSRAECVAPKLQELNSMVLVRQHTGALTEEVVSRHNAMVASCMTLTDLTYWGAYCHQHGITFIATDVFGPSGYVFSDFGPSFVVKDKSGEQPVVRIITRISNHATEPVISILGADINDDGGRMLNIQDDDHEGWIDISDVEGMTSTDDRLPASINDYGSLRIQPAYKSVTKQETKKDGTIVTVTRQVFDAYRVKVVADTSRLTAYVNGGVLTQTKKPVRICHRDLASNLVNPVSPGEFGLVFTDGTKFGRGEQLHLAYLAMWEFEHEHGRMPRVNDVDDANAVVKHAQEISKRHADMNIGKETPVAMTWEAVDEAVVTTIALLGGIDFQPYCALFGGIVAQEIVKLTSKFSPLNQWLHLDCLELLPAEADRRGADLSPVGSRYDDLIAMFGREFVQKVHDAKTFMIGCGALGCEFLKNFALVGLGTGEIGGITVTDNDRIEVSNLSRQFLFREHNVGQPKSVAASAAVRQMNPNLRLKCLELLVSPASEDKFPDEFWESLNFVTNALDNVKARVYVDQRCVFFGKPLLESGTLGTKCNVQVIVPHLTRSYTDMKDEENEDHIPMCTLRNFPSLIEHCIEWSRAQFEDVFKKPFADAKKFSTDPATFIGHQRAAGGNRNGRVTAIAELKSLLTVLNEARNMTFEKCVAKANDYFHHCFRNRILQLTFNYPEDSTNTKGDKFWSGAKRFPYVAHFDANDEFHMTFVVSVANIFAAAFGVCKAPEVELLPADHHWRNTDHIKSILAQNPVAEFVPSKEEIDVGGKQDETKDDGAMVIDRDAEEVAEFEGLLGQLQAFSSTTFVFQPADFEKDQDMNFHIDFITAASNLRASNYRIRQATRHKCKMIAGKIIPAIATTTASVCGLVMVELLKVLQDKKLVDLRDSSNNLGLNMYMLSEPAEPIKATDSYDDVMLADVKCFPAGFTKWDKIVVDARPTGGRMTLAEFIAEFKRLTNLNVTSLYHAVSELDGPQRSKLLYEQYAWKKELQDVYNAAMTRELTDYIRERYEGSPSAVIAEGRRYVELQVTCSNDEDAMFKTPIVIFRWN